MSAQKRTVSGALGGFLGFIGMSAVAGVLVTAAVTPALALTGITASSSITMFENLPGYLKIDDLAEKSNIYAVANDGSTQLLASFYDQNRERATWDQVSPYLKDAAIAGEDPRFYEHGGIDLQGTLRAATVTVTGGDVQGGSSITQQYVKNVLVQNAESNAKSDEEKLAAVKEAIKQTPDRKLKEMRYAIGLEKEYSKDEILLGYLNIASFGGRVYGVEAAAQYYFSVSAANVSVEQAAALIAMVNNPNELRIDQPENEVNGAADGYAENLERRNYILQKMADETKITQEQYEAAVALPIVPVITEPSTGCQTATVNAFFCDYVKSVIGNNPAFGADDAARAKLLERGGLDIYTTLDLDVQQAAVTAMNDNVPKIMDGVDIGGVAVSVQLGTGRILAMVQNKDYSQDPEVQAQGLNWTGINYNTDYEYGGSSGFQPGSTYKVFTLAEWLKEGHSLTENIDGRRRDFTKFKDSCNGDWYGSFNPKNDEGGNGGQYTANSATKGSINTAFVAMASKLDLCGIKQTAMDLGVHRADGNPLEMNPSDVLGTQEIAPLTMAEAFAGIANGGVVCEPIAIDRVTLPDGTDLPVPPQTCKQGLDPAVAAGTASAMAQVFQGGGTATASRVGDGIPLIGKTGTTDNNEATWMSGASTTVATVVGVFNVTGHVNLRQQRFESGEAATARHRIWPRIMEVANAKYGGTEFAKPSGSVVQGVQVSVPDVRGMTPDAAMSAIENAGFAYAYGGILDSSLPAGQMFATDPAAGGTAGRGSLITAFESNGALIPVPTVVGGSANDAKKKLEAAGFTVQFSKNPDGNDIVTGQTPAGGAEAPRGSVIQVVLGNGSGG